MDNVVYSLDVKNIKTTMRVMAKELVSIKVEIPTRRDYKITAAMVGLEMGELAQLALALYKKKLKINVS